MKKIRLVILSLIFFLFNMVSFAQDISEEQKMINATNQLIPHYLNGAKNKGPDFLKSTSINVQLDSEWDTVYSIDTIQPIGKVSDKGNLLFFQGAYNHRKDDKGYSNFGVGFRNLSKDKTRIVGLNLFVDKEYEHQLSRLGLGFEFFKNLTEFRVNYYYPTSDDVVIGRGSNAFGYTTTYIRAVEGIDYSMNLLNRKFPWLKVGLTGTYWNNEHNKDEQSYKVNTMLQITPKISTELYYQDSNIAEENYGMAISYKLANGFVSSLFKNKWFDTKDLSNRMLEKVVRNSVIKTETYTKTTPFQGNLSVTVRNTSNNNNPISGVQLQAYQNGNPIGNSVITNSSGIGTITGLDVGTYTVKANYFSNEKDSAEKLVEKNQTTDETIEFEIATGKITLNVLDSNANKVSGAKVIATPVIGGADQNIISRSVNNKNISRSIGGVFSLETTTDSNGQAIFDNLPANAMYTFNVENSQGNISENSDNIYLSSGEQTVNVVLPNINEDTSTKGTASILVKQKSLNTVISGATVTLKQDDRTISTATTNDDGIAVFSNREAGAYSVVITKDGYKDTTRSFDITADKTINVEELMEKTISLSSIGLTAPATGATGATIVTETNEYEGYVTWSPILVNGKFAGNTSYTATLNIIPKEGYTLTGVTENFFTVTGATSTTNSADSGSVTVVFPATESPLTPVTLGSITTLTAPFNGDTPDTTIQAVGSYSVESITWDNNPSTFVLGQVYTARIAITAKTGYTLTGINTGSLAVTGATSATYNNGVITVVFPGAFPKEITITTPDGAFVLPSISLVNNRPYYSITNPASGITSYKVQYTGDVNKWAMSKGTSSGQHFMVAKQNSTETSPPKVFKSNSGSGTYLVDY